MSERGRRDLAAADALAVLDELRGIANGPVRLDRLRRRTAIRALERRGLVADGMAVDRSVKPGAVLAVDIGGSKVRAALADRRGDLLDERVEATVQGGAPELLEQVRALDDELVAACDIAVENVRAAAVGIPASYDPDGDRLWNSGNLSVLEGMRPAAAFGAALMRPVVVRQDVRLAALGERWRGLARGIDDAAIVWIGTGIAMGLIVEGSLVAGSRHAAGEIGHLPMGRDPFDAKSHRLGPFELAVSGPALAGAFAATIGLPPSRDARAVFVEAARGDPRAVAALATEASLLALGIAAVVGVVDSELVVLGGGIGARPELRPLVEAQVARLVTPSPRIETSRLGNHSPLLGGVALALSLAEGRESRLRWVRSQVPASRNSATLSERPANMEGFEPRPARRGLSR